LKRNGKGFAKKAFMEANINYEKYKNCFANAARLLNRYKKYHSCFDIAGIDEEINTLFNKILSDFIKIKLLVYKPVSTNPSCIDENPFGSPHENKNKLEEKALFLAYIADFTSRHEAEILHALENNLHNHILTYISDLEYDIIMLNSSIKQMEGILISAQNIYHIVARCA
jgi:hypothetical protein